MDRTNTEVFSPIRNFDEEKLKRRSDSFSKFLKGPDVFNSENVENVIETTTAKRISKSNKTLQKKAGKSKTLKSEALASSAFKHNIAFTHSPNENSSLKKDESENLSLTSKSSKDFSLNFVATRNDKLRTNNKSEAECNKEKHHSHQAKQNSVKSSLQSGSKEIKKTDESSSVNQQNPISQVQSGILEQIVNNAVESQVDDIRQLMWSQYSDLVKTIHIFKDEMEQRHASESTTMFKIIEELLEENRMLRNAILARQ